MIIYTFILQEFAGHILRTYTKIKILKNNYTYLQRPYIIYLEKSLKK